MTSALMLDLSICKYPSVCVMLGSHTSNYEESSSWMLGHIVWYIFSNILEEPAVCIFMVEAGTMIYAGEHGQ
jgi:hypothetical protein